MTYQDELTIKLNQQTQEVINELPSFCQKFFDSIKEKGQSPRTMLQYAYDLGRFFDYLYSAGGFKKDTIRHATASEVLDRLKIDDLQEYFASFEYYTTLDQNGAETTHLTSPAAKARRISSLRSFYKYLCEKHTVITNARFKNKVTGEQYTKGQTTTLTGEEIERINSNKWCITHSTNLVTLKK